MSSTFGGNTGDGRDGSAQFSTRKTHIWRFQPQLLCKYLDLVC